MYDIKKTGLAISKAGSYYQLTSMDELFSSFSKRTHQIQRVNYLLSPTRRSLN